MNLVQSRPKRQHLLHHDPSVLLITGGSGPERAGSLRSAEDAISALAHLGMRCSVRDLNDLDHAELRTCDFAFLAIHGWWGEDGKLQGALELAGVPYNGSGVAASAIAMHKPLCNRIAENAGLNVPRWMSCDRRNASDKSARALFGVFNGRVFLKPASGGGSLGACVVDSPMALGECLRAAALEEAPLLACACIEGIDVTVAVFEIGEELTVLPPLAIHHDAPFYDYDTKHAPAARRYECPAALPDATAAAVCRDAQNMFTALGCHGYARFDFMVDREGTPWFLEVNTLPGLSRQGNLATMAAPHGWDYEELIARIVASIGACQRYRP